MRLRRLRLENYRKYRSAEVEFPDGIMGIVGRNGAGKSTLIEAIGWCIYGGNAVRTNQKQADIITTGVPPGTECRVILDVEMDGEAITITRVIRQGRLAADARLHSRGQGGPAVTGGQEVSSYMARRMGMDRVAFFSSVFAQQKELAGLSRLGIAERKKTVLRLLGVDTVEKALVLIKNDARDLRRTIEDRRSVVADERKIKEELADLERRRKAAAKKVEGSAAAAAELGRKAEAAKENHALLEDAKSKNQAHKADLDKEQALCESGRRGLAEQEAELKGLRKDDRDLEPLRPSLRRYAPARKNLEKLDSDEAKHEKWAAANAALARAEGQIEGLREENKKISKERDAAKTTAAGRDDVRQKMSSLQAKLEGARDGQASARTERSGALDKASALEAELAEIIPLKELGKCPRCKQTLGDGFATLLASTRREIQALREKGASLQEAAAASGRRIESATSELDDAREQLERCQNAEGEISALEASLASNDKQIDGLLAEVRSAEEAAKESSNPSYDRKDRERARREFERIESDYNRALELQERVRRMPTVKSKIKELKDAIRGHEKAIREEKAAIRQIAFDEGTYADSMDAREEADRSYHEAREKTIELEGDLKELRQEIKGKKSDLKEAKKAALEIKGLEEQGKTLGLLQDHMDRFKTGLISRIRPTLSIRTSDLLRLTTSGKYPFVEFDDDYAVKIASDGDNFALDRFSGGEQDLVSLCLRIAISKELSERAGSAGSNFIVLDEVFGSQDVERKSAILDALDGLSGEFGQILLITHIEDVREALPYALHIIEDKDGSSRIEVESRHAAPAGLAPPPPPDMATQTRDD